MQLMDAYKLPVVNISQFYPRPGTPAARMKRIPTRVVKDRSRLLSKAFNSWDPYSGTEGKKVLVWFSTEVATDKELVTQQAAAAAAAAVAVAADSSGSGSGSNSSNISRSEAADARLSVGHTKSYVKVLVPFDPDLPGTTHMVEMDGRSVVPAVFSFSFLSCLLSRYKPYISHTCG